MALTEGLVLNGLDLNSGSTYHLEALDMTPPAKLPEWAKGADDDGQALVRTPLFDNRTITAQVRIDPQPTQDLALAAVGAIIDQLQEAEQQPGGLALVWTPANGTKSITFYVLTGQVTGFPISVDQTPGWFVNSPIVTLTLTCKPFGYGAETTVTAVSSGAAPYAIVTIPTVAGDVPAEGRLVVTDTASTSRRYVEWGLEQRYYNAATALYLANTSMTVQTGGGGFTRAGSFVATVIRSNLPGSTYAATPAAICATGVLAHVGTFRVRARVYPSSPSVVVRFTWQDSDGPNRSNPYVTPTTSGSFVDVDLGLISITPAVTGAQKWSGQVEAYGVSGDQIDVDYLLFIPVSEGYGKARGVQLQGAGALVSFDNTQSGAGNLNGRVANIGPAWVTTGSATDFQQSGTSFTRSTVSDATPRFATITAARGDTHVQMYQNLVFYQRTGALVRYVDANNYVAAYWDAIAETLTVVVVVAGVTVATGSSFIVPLAPTNVAMHLIVYSTGSIGALMFAGGDVARVGVTSLAVATGGALASGAAGLYDFHPSANTGARTINSVTVFQPPPEQLVCYPSRSIEVRSSDTVRQDTTGVYYGRPSLYRGSRFYVPQSGSAARTTRIFARAIFDDVDLPGIGNQDVTKSFTVQPFWTPRYHVVPR